MQGERRPHLSHTRRIAPAVPILQEKERMWQSQRGPAGAVLTWPRVVVVPWYVDVDGVSAWLMGSGGIGCLAQVVRLAWVSAGLQFAFYAVLRRLQNPSELYSESFAEQ